MKSKTIILVTLSVALFTGCTVRTKGFIEDLYSNTKTLSSQQHTVRPAQIRQSQPTSNTQKEQTYTIPEVYTATGKILDITYDQDVDLYIYTFLKLNDLEPIIFYYNKNLNLKGAKVTIVVKENFLKSITKEIKTKRTLKKRIKSPIKTPIIEKINTL